MVLVVIIIFSLFFLCRHNICINVLYITPWQVAYINALLQFVFDEYVDIYKLPLAVIVPLLTYNLG